MSDPYNPLDKRNLGKSVAEALLDAEAYPLGALPNFEGAGIYVIYYRGDHPAYERLAEANREEWLVPIYIGKAIPSGGRTGASVFSKIRGNFLLDRLEEHAESVKDAENLDINAFAARWLVVDDIWIPLGEALLISKFQPVWNGALAGFGNHNPGSGRRDGKVPKWDVLHPGRKWAPLQKGRSETAEDLEKQVRAYLDKQEFPEDPHIKFTPPNEDQSP